LSNSNRHCARRTAAGILASTLALSGVVAAATPANAAAGFGFDRLAGNDRYETSAAVTARYRATGTDAITNVIVASGESGRTPDALAANFLAGIQNAPVLLTRKDTTPEPILEQLRALRAAGATTLTVVGGTAAISDMQLESFRTELGFTTVTRLGGLDRYETALKVVLEGEASPLASNIGLVASGTSTIDALAGGPLAYKGKHPLFLVEQDAIPGATAAAIIESEVTSVYILGGETRVGPDVVTLLEDNGIEVLGRLAGVNRSETSVRIAEALVADFGFTNTTFNLASGANEGIDALGGAALSGKENRPLLITNTAEDAAPVVAHAMRNAATLNAVGHIFGGTEVVERDLENAIVRAGGGTVFGDVTLSAMTVQQGGTLTGTIAGDVQSASVSGCGLTDQALADADGAMAGRQFTVTVPATQAAGECTLAFTATPVGGGAAVTTTVTVTVTAAPPPQTAPAAPTAVSAEAGTGEASDDITVTVSFAAGADADNVVIQRAEVTGAGNTDEATTGTVGTFTTVHTASPTAAQLAAGSFTFLDENVPAGTYRYRAALTNEAGSSAFTADPNNETATTPTAPPANVAPEAIDATFVDEATDADTIFGDEVGDVIRLALTEVVERAAGATISIDPDGAGATAPVVLTCGTNVTCTDNTANSQFGLTSTATTPAIPLDATSTVSATTGLTDPEGAAVTGLPELID